MINYVEIFKNISGKVENSFVAWSIMEKVLEKKLYEWIYFYFKILLITYFSKKFVSFFDFEVWSIFLQKNPTVLFLRKKKKKIKAQNQRIT